MSTKAERDAMRGILCPMNEFTPGRTPGLLELLDEIDECKSVIRDLLKWPTSSTVLERANKLLEG